MLRHRPGNGIVPLMLQEVAHESDNGWQWLLQLSLSERTFFLVSIEAIAYSISALPFK